MSLRWGDVREFAGSVLRCFYTTNSVGTGLNLSLWAAITGLGGPVSNNAELPIFLFLLGAKQILSHNDLKNSNLMTEEAKGFLGLEHKLHGEVPEGRLRDSLREWEEEASYASDNNYGKISSSRKLLQNIPSDENVLLQFKQAILEDPSGVLLGWNLTANADYCQWRGVTCDRSATTLSEEIFLDRSI